MSTPTIRWDDFFTESKGSRGATAITVNTASNYNTGLSGGQLWQDNGANWQISGVNGAITSGQLLSCKTIKFINNETTGPVQWLLRPYAEPLTNAQIAILTHRTSETGPTPPVAILRGIVSSTTLNGATAVGIGTVASGTPLVFSNASGFQVGQTILIDTAGQQETLVIAAIAGNNVNTTTNTTKTHSNSVAITGQQAIYFNTCSTSSTDYSPNLSTQINGTNTALASIAALYNLYPDNSDVCWHVGVWDIDASHVAARVTLRRADNPGQTLTDFTFNGSTGFITNNISGATTAFTATSLNAFAGFTGTQGLMPRTFNAPGTCTVRFRCGDGTAGQEPTPDISLFTGAADPSQVKLAVQQLTTVLATPTQVKLSCPGLVTTVGNATSATTSSNGTVTFTLYRYTGFNANGDLASMTSLGTVAIGSLSSIVDNTVSPDTIYTYKLAAQDNGTGTPSYSPPEVVCTPQSTIQLGVSYIGGPLLSTTPSNVSPYGGGYWNLMQSCTAQLEALLGGGTGFPFVVPSYQAQTTANAPVASYYTGGAATAQLTSAVSAIATDWTNGGLPASTPRACYLFFGPEDALAGTTLANFQTGLAGIAAYVASQGITPVLVYPPYVVPGTQANGNVAWSEAAVELLRSYQSAIDAIGGLYVYSPKHKLAWKDSGNHNADWYVDGFNFNEVGLDQVASCLAVPVFEFLYRPVQSVTMLDD